MGGEQPRKEPNYWQLWSRVEAKLQELTQDLGEFPSSNWLRVNGHSSLEKAIGKYHGGMNVARDQIGAKQANVKHGYWKDWSNVEAELRKITQKLGRFPSSAWLRQKGRHSLEIAIRSYHGGIRSVRERLGAEQPQVEGGHWLDWSNVEAELRKITQELGRFPSSTWLQYNRRGALAQAIQKHHSGFAAVRARIAYDEIGSVILSRYADQIAEVFMHAPGDAVNFEDFLAELERDCRYERDLRVRLGLPPEPDTD